MNQFFLRLLASLCLLGLLQGCGEPKPKVDLAAQTADLASTDSDKKVAALAEISKLGRDASSVVDKIIPLLKDEDNIVRRTAAYTLGVIGPAAKAAVPELKNLMKTTDRDQMTAVANALRAIEPSAVDGVKIENTQN